MPDEYNHVRDVESTKGTSVLSGARSVSEFLQASDGKDATALDSTQETSTVQGARSVEEIMEQMKEEDQAKSASAKSSVKSSVKSKTDKWKNIGVNAKKTVSEVTDTVDEVKNNSLIKTATVLSTGKLPSSSSPVLRAISIGASAFGFSKAGEAVADKVTGQTEESKTDPVQVSQAMQAAAPTDVAIATYQKDVAEAKSTGTNVKMLPFTNEQQMQWNAQDQHRMYSNYGNLYEHGDNELNYNMALLSSAMASVNMPAKTLQQMSSIKQKVLAATKQVDNQMDINNLSFDKLFAGEVDLLSVDQKAGTENLADINAAHVQDAGKQSLSESFNQAAAEGTKAFTEDVLQTVDRGKTVDFDLGLVQPESAEKELESAFF